MKDELQRLLDEADVQIDGDRPWDIQVHDDEFYRRVASGGSLALGESYMDGWWDCDALDEFFYRIIRADIPEKAGESWRAWWYGLKARLLNLQSRSRAYEVGREHYDLGNDLFVRMLDERMVYSCGYWREAEDLDAAQEAKLDLVCRKVQLEPGMRVLDIGCGWGSFAEYAAEEYGVEVVGITVSEEQVKEARRRTSDLPVEIRLQDYRDLEETFDRIVSIGMFEHVGYKNYPTYMEVVRRCLAPDGLFLLHTIGSRRSVASGDPWMEKYIFPNGMLPSARQITDAAEELLVMEDWHNFGVYYDRTLMAWYENFTTYWDELREEYGQRFYRMWTYNLLMNAGAFRARHNHLWQIVYTADGLEGGYESVR